jgi:hypothetical protein
MRKPFVAITAFALVPLGAAVTLWTYVCVVFLYQQSVVGMRFGAAKVALTWAAGTILIIIASAWAKARGRLSPSRMLNAGVAILSLQLSVLVADIGYSMFVNAKRWEAYRAIPDEQRAGDPHVWQGELIPRLYFPTDKNFRLLKPNVELTASTYGLDYNPTMLKSRTMTGSVLQLRRVSYVIGPHGLRGQEPLAGTRLFALGDSFTFGIATDQGKTWTDLLGASLHEPVFNMGVSSTGPRAQLHLLRYMLATNPDSMHVGHLFWMIFEGNDLEDSYDDARAIEPDRLTLATLLEGTVLQALASLPGRFKDESIARRLLDGEISVSTRLRTRALGGQYEIDGVPLSVPLYHSTRWGYRLFRPEFVERATKSREYVLNHPHRPLLDQTFQDMRALSQHFGFEVTVIVAPSDARLYGSDFDEFPKLSDKPYFVDYVIELAGRQGFNTVNLLALLQPFARRELLYWRDDHHWNERGNAVVADLLKNHVTPAPGLHAASRSGR